MLSKRPDVLSDSTTQKITNDGKKPHPPSGLTYFYQNKQTQTFLIESKVAMSFPVVNSNGQYVHLCFQS